jgi:LmbE family N-acetylglucosaminyl deacetylase
VVIAGAHPDDPETGCGGTIAGLSDVGHEVVILYLTSGALKARLSKKRAGYAPPKLRRPARFSKLARCSQARSTAK